MANKRVIEMHGECERNSLRAFWRGVACGIVGSGIVLALTW